MTRQLNPRPISIAAVAFVTWCLVVTVGSERSAWLSAGIPSGAPQVGVVGCTAPAITGAVPITTGATGASPRGAVTCYWSYA
jgi:hypothetical protein